MYGDPYRGYAGNDYPAEEVRAIPPARANAVRARLEHERRAQSDLYRWIDRSWDDFTNSKEYMDTSANERKAQDAYNRERDKVLKKLNDDSNYRTLKDLIADISEKMEHQRPHTMNAMVNADAMEDMLAMATVKLGYLSQLSAMETAAMNADKSVQDSRTALPNFRQPFTRDAPHLRSQAPPRRELPRRPYADRRSPHQQGRGRHVPGDAINARCVARDDAYYVHRWDQYKYSQYGSTVTTVPITGRITDGIDRFVEVT